MDAYNFLQYFILLVYHFFIMKIYYAKQIFKKVMAKFHLFRIKITSVENDVLFLEFYYNTDS